MHMLVLRGQEPAAAPLRAGCLRTCSFLLCHPGSLRDNRPPVWGDHWKRSQHVRLWCHRGGHSLSSVGQGRQDSRLEPLECRDLLVQNALFTGDLEMVQKFFPKNAAINLIIEARGEELRWTCRKLAQSLAEEGSSRFCTGFCGGFGPCIMGSIKGGGDKSREPICTRKVDGPGQAYWQALLTGDQEIVAEILSEPQNNLSPSAVFDTSDLEEWKNYRFNIRGLRLWSLSYEQELTTPLHITASRGYTACLRLLLLRGAAVDFAPGGCTALHEACRAASADCLRLLLDFGADPQAVSEDGYQPLHLCKSPDSIECVQQLLQHGACVNSRTEEEGDTALHIAARHGLTEHVRLLLCHGAELEAENEEGQTPLNAACAQPHQPQDMGRYYQVCQLLVESGASINAADKDRQHPLHLACKNSNAQIVELLLAQGANVNVMNYSGNMALHNVLQTAPYKLEHHPELVVQALLNHGAVRVWPGSLLKVLRYCHSCPRVVEALMNSYDHVRVSEDWVEAVPEEVVQKYPCFYQSLFSLEHRPRSLQHLARCALRTFLEGRLLLVLPQLHLPKALHQFLLLGFEDVLY
ncbi:ankyrin repeat and SOCS box protein 10 [Dryobates pubescens]|uniref:ankyrin repeat and SOCS box protein 10 n=1 Tax=Dryobates pubescens TaxID=118200 RepID=UPI0023B9AF3E|nr:ankyrin repeat and SOCS box protein 10 [Dryobates pubescens]